MALADTLSFGATTAAWVQTVIVAVSLGFIWWQAREAARALRVLVSNATADALHGINEIQLDHQELQEMTGEAKTELFCHIRFNRFEQWWALEHEGLLKQASKDATRRWISQVMQQGEMARVWAANKRLYREDFARWIDECCKS